MCVDSRAIVFINRFCEARYVPMYAIPAGRCHVAADRCKVAHASSKWYHVVVSVTHACYTVVGLEFSPVVFAEIGAADNRVVAAAVRFGSYAIVSIRRGMVNILLLIISLSSLCYTIMVYVVNNYYSFLSHWAPIP